MRRSTLLLSFVAILALGPLAADAGPARPIDRPPEFVEKVNQAIDRGVDWLRKTQAADGSFTDFPDYPAATTALAYHTMRVCGVAREAPEAKRCWDALRRRYRADTMQTYSAALVLMAIAEHGDRVAGVRDDRDVKLGADDRKWADEVARVLVGGQDAKGRWSYGVGGAAGGMPAAGFAPGAVAGGIVYDNSNTQFALLGLKSAARCGVAVAPQVWARSLDHFLAEQEADGREVPRGGAVAAPAPARPGQTYAHQNLTDRARGWGYQGAVRAPGRPAGAYASMTAGGVGSVVICRSELLGTPTFTAKLDGASERAAWDGLAWLGTRWKPDPFEGLPPAWRERMKGVGGASFSCYEFYAVERAGVLAGVDRMAGLDWYGGGAGTLVSLQEADGSWEARDERVVVGGATDRALRVADTCFALLFLKRGTAPVRRGAATTAEGDTDVRFADAAKLAGRDLEDLLDLVLQRWTRSQDDATRARLLDGATSIGAKIVEPLLARLASPDEPTRAAAHALLRRATGLDFAYDPAAATAARKEATVRWRAWWGANARTLRYDPAAKLLLTP